MFTKVQVFCKKNDCCFDKIKNSSKPYVLINTDQICSLGQKTDWGFCTEYRDYPFRVLDMKNGDTFLVVLESANELEKLLLHGIGNEKQEWSEEDKQMIGNIENDYHNRLGAGIIPQKYHDNVIAWLKSIRPQNRWRPSEEQIKVVNEVMNHAADSEKSYWNDYIYNVLKDLIKQLKKL